MEEPLVLEGGRIGTGTLLKVVISANVHVLDISQEYPPLSVDASYQEALLGDQGFALAGWLERNGFSSLGYILAKNLASITEDPIGSMFDHSLEKLWNNKLSPTFKKLGIGGIRYQDRFLKGPQSGKRFPALAIFNPAHLSLLQ